MAEPSKHTQALHAQLWERNPVAMGMLNLDLYFESVNLAFEQLTGYTEAEAKTRHITQYIHPEDLQAFEGKKAELLATGEGSFDHRILHKNGSVISVRVITSLVKDEQGTPTGISGILIDRTRASRQERELDTARRVIENLQDGVVMHSREGLIVFANQRAHELVGAQPGALVGQLIWDRNPEMSQARWEVHWKELEAHGERLIESVLTRNDGRIIHVEHSVVMHTFEGRPVTITTSRDITERLEREKRMRRKRFALNHSQTSVVWTTAEGHLDYANPAAAELLGQTLEALEGSRHESFEPELPSGSWEAEWQALERDKHRKRMSWWKHASGRLIPVEISSDFMDFGDDQICMSQVQDITERLAQQRLIEEERSRFKAIVELAPAAVFLVTPQGYLVEANARFVDLFGIDKSRLPEMHYEELVDARDLHYCAVNMADVLNKKQVLQEKRWKSQDGRVFWGRMLATHVPDSNGEVQYALAMIEDVTTERQERRELLQAKFCMDQSADAISLLGPDSSYLYVNEQYARLMREPVERFEQLKVIDVDPDFTEDKWKRHWEKMRRNPEHRLQRELIRRDGSRGYLDIHRSFREFDGEAVIISISRDITDQHETLRELAKARFSLDTAADAISWSNSKGQLVYHNQAYSELMGYSREELTSLTLQDLDPEMSGGNWEKYWSRLKANGHLLFETEALHKEGHFVPVELSLNFHEIDGDEYSFAFIRDISDRKAKERKLRRSEALFRTLFEGSPIGMGMSNSDQEITLTNQTLQEMFGYSAEEFRSLKVMDLLHPDSHATQHDQYFRIARAGQQLTAEMRYVRKDGSMFWGLRSGMRLLNDDGELDQTMGMIIDITAEREARESLTKSERDFRVLFEENPVAIAVASPSGKLINGNAAFRALLGYSSSEVEQLSILSLAPTDERDKVDRLHSQVLEHGVVRTDRKYLHKDGSIIETANTVTLLRDEQGEPISLIAMIEDLTERRRSEMLLQRQQELERSNRELEQFVHVASHDLREPLRSIRTLGDMLLKTNRDRLDAHGVKCMEFIQQASTRMDTLMRGLLDYSRLGSDRTLEQVDLTEMVKDLCDDLYASIHEAGAAVNALQLPTIAAFGNELRLLLQNLISNGIKFRSPERAPVVTIRAKELPDQWLLSVADNGIGIPKHKREQIFFMFRRLHGEDQYEGSGIGLAHCKRIAEIHGGNIWVEGAEGEGSTFFVSISKLL